MSTQVYKQKKTHTPVQLPLSLLLHLQLVLKLLLQALFGEINLADSTLILQAPLTTWEEIEMELAEYLCWSSDQEERNLTVYQKPPSWMQVLPVEQGWQLSLVQKCSQHWLLQTMRARSKLSFKRTKTTVFSNLLTVVVDHKKNASGEAHSSVYLKVTCSYLPKMPCS